MKEEQERPSPWALEKARAEGERAADLRWAAALKHADWDGGVFHYEGRIYPWPRGFVPDCPATWEEKLRPLRAEIEEARERADLAADVLDTYAKELTQVRAEHDQAIDALRALIAEVAEPCLVNPDTHRFAKAADEPVCRKPARWGYITAWACDEHKDDVMPDAREVPGPALLQAMGVLRGIR